MKPVTNYNPHLGYKDDVIANNIRLAYKIAHQYKNYCNYYSVDIGDFIGEASIGLLRAFNSYDPSKQDVKFQTFAARCMHNEICRFIRDKINVIRVPRKLKIGLNEKLLVSLNWMNPEAEEEEEVQNTIPTNDDLSYLEANPFFDLLTQEEKKITAWLLQGLKQTEIAEQLGYSRQLLRKRVIVLRDKLTNYNNDDNSYNNEMGISS